MTSEEKKESGAIDYKALLIKYMQMLHTYVEADLHLDLADIRENGEIDLTEAESTELDFLQFSVTAAIERAMVINTIAAPLIQKYPDSAETINQVIALEVDHWIAEGLIGKALINRVQQACAYQQFEAALRGEA